MMYCLSLLLLLLASCIEGFSLVPPSTVATSTNEPLCDLQTLLRLADCGCDSGGAAKSVIQAGECQLNGAVETRRAKKLFSGDIVTLHEREYVVDEIVRAKNYQYKPKTKKIADKKMLENGGQYRSKEWRAQRKERKLASYGSDEWRGTQRLKKSKEKDTKKKVENGVAMIYLSYLGQIGDAPDRLTTGQRLKVFGRIWQTTYAHKCTSDRLSVKIGILNKLLITYKEQCGFSLSDADIQIITGGKNPEDLRGAANR